MGDHNVIQRSDNSYGANLRMRSGTASPSPELLLPPVEKMGGLKLTNSSSKRDSITQRTSSSGSLNARHSRNASRDSFEGGLATDTSSIMSTAGEQEVTSASTPLPPPSHQQPVKVKVLCSFNGEMQRDSSAKIVYLGGETRIVSITKGSTREGLLSKLDHASTTEDVLKYVLPGEDEILVTVNNDEDMGLMVEEWESFVLHGGSPALKLRAFVLPKEPGSSSGGGGGNPRYQSASPPPPATPAAAAGGSSGHVHLPDDAPTPSPRSSASEEGGTPRGRPGSANTATAVNRMTGLELISSSELEAQRTLGEGSFGVVALAKWGGVDVAVKWLRMNLFGGESEESQRRVADFYREANILGTLRHPNIVMVYGVIKQQDDGGGGERMHGPGIVTEFMPEGSLSRALKGGKLDGRRRLALALDAARGMAYLHSKKIVHFDLKTDNLLVGRIGKRLVCKVCDFGLSRQRQQTYVSELSWRHGTLAYTAPEVLKSPDRVGDKADVFSFAIVMWELWSSKRPYTDVAEPALLAGMMFQGMRPLIPTDEVPPHTSWSAVMQSCWDEDPDARPTFERLCDLLQDMLGELEAEVAAAKVAAEAAGSEAAAAGQ